MDSILKSIEASIKQYYKRRAETSSEKIDKVTLSEPVYDAREAIRVCRTLLEGWISQGPNVREFEAAFSKFIGCSEGVAVNSGSSANLLAILALKERLSLQGGDEVIVPAATFATVAAPVIQAGLVPVYVDIRRDTFNIDSQAVQKAISGRTRILMPVHTLGYPAEMDALIEIAAKHKLAILEDCCEAHGSSIEDRKVGSFGVVSTFSFFVAHNMTTGEGGMIVTNDQGLATVCRSLREFGRCDPKTLADQRYHSDESLKDYDRRYLFERIGYNLRMTDVTAALGLEQLVKLEGMNKRRRENAAWLRGRLEETVGDYLTMPVEQPGYRHTYYTFPVVLSTRCTFSRREFAEHLETHGIETRPLFAGCLPDQPAFRKAPGRIVGALLNARFIRDNLLFVGIHPGLTVKHLEYMADVMASFIKQRVA